MIDVERFAYSPHGTFGLMKLEGFECYTVERPWLDNRPRESCIPEGDYEVVEAHFYAGGYPCPEILDVPGRSLIKIHVGNTMRNVVGCLAVGEDIGYVDGLWAVTRSRDTFQLLMQAIELPDTIRIYAKEI